MRKKSSLEGAENIKVKLIGTLVLSLLLFSSVALVEASPDFDLLIIAPENFTSVLRPLVDHKRATEMPTQMITLEHIYGHFVGADEPEKIKHAIESYEKFHSIKYVMLVGDCNKFPVRWQFGNLVDGHIDEMVYVPSDFYYADLYDENGAFNDWDADNDRYYGEIYRDDLNPDHIDPHPDVAVARVPAADITQVETYVAKVIRYEYTAYDSDWFKRLLLIQKEFGVHVGMNENISGCLSPLDFQTLRLYEDIGPADYSGPTNGTPTAANISNMLNNGAGFVSEYYHGHPTTWGFYNIVNIINDLNNSDMPPVIFSLACQTSQFFNATIPYCKYLGVDGVEYGGVGVGSGVANVTVFPQPAVIQQRYNQLAISEAFLVASDNGSIAYYGCMETGESGPDHWPQGHKPLGESFFEAYSIGNNILGDMWNYSVETFAEVNDLDNIVADGWVPACKMHTPSRFILFGDPSLRVGGEPNLEDTEPPETTDDADRDWHNCDVMVTLTATDVGEPPSGVRITNYSIDGGDWVTGNHLTIEAPSNHSNDGIHSIDYFSIDFLRNTEAVKNAEIRIDTYPPRTAVLLDGEPPAMVLCPCYCPPDNPGCECECPKQYCYATSVTVSFNATDYPPTPTTPVSGVDYIDHDCCGSPYHSCGYTEPFDVSGSLREIITLKYWSVDNAGNVNWPPNEVTFCVSNWRIWAVINEMRIFATRDEIIAIKMINSFADTLPPINYVRFDYAGPYPTEQPDWVTMGVDHNGNDGWGIHWGTTNVLDGYYRIRMSVIGSEFRQVIYQEQLSVTVCNIPNSAYDFKLYAPDEIDRGEVIRYTLKFDNKMDRPLTNLNMICDLDTGFFDKIEVLDEGYLNKQGMPTWFRKVLKSGETWKVRFKGKIKHDIYPGMIITSQALITADTVPLLLSDDPTTLEEDDYTAVAIRLINGSITGKVEDDKYGTAITASVAIDGAVTQNITTDGSGIYLFSDLPPGDYNVSVDAENYDYLSPTAPVTVTLDGTGASIQVDFFMARKDIIPPVSSILLSADEIVQESMTEIYGTAYDYPPGSGMSKVELSIERNNDRKYWDGNSWERKETWLLALGTTEWTFKCSGIAWNSRLSYTIRSRATDNVGNVEKPIAITTTPAAPILTSPANGTKTNDPTPTFNWSDVPDSIYILQVDNNRDFFSPEIHKSYFLTTSTYTPIFDLADGTYYWRVKAVSSAYLESKWSEVRTVTTTP